MRPERASEAHEMGSHGWKAVPSVGHGKGRVTSCYGFGPDVTFWRFRLRGMEFQTNHRRSLSLLAVANRCPFRQDLEDDDALKSLCLKLQFRRKVRLHLQ